MKPVLKTRIEHRIIGVGIRDEGVARERLAQLRERTEDEAKPRVGPVMWSEIEPFGINEHAGYRMHCAWQEVYADIESAT